MGRDCGGEPSWKMVEVEVYIMDIMLPGGSFYGG